MKPSIGHRFELNKALAVALAKRSRRSRRVGCRRKRRKVQKRAILRRAYGNVAVALRKQGLEMWHRAGQKKEMEQRAGRKKGWSSVWGGRRGGSDVRGRGE